MLLAISPIVSGCERSAPNMPAGLLTSQAAQDAGGTIFAADCAICHGTKGDGRGQRREAMRPAPANLMLPPWSEAAAAPRIYLAIKNGVPNTAMPPWPMLDDEAIWNVVAYIHALKAP